MNLSYLNKNEKIAILLIALGPKCAGSILKNIHNEKLIEELVSHISSFNNVSIELLNAVVNEFHPLFCTEDWQYSGGVMYAKEVLQEAYGNDKAAELTKDIICDIEEAPFLIFREVDAIQVAKVLASEKAEDIALVLIYLPAENAANILTVLDKELQINIIEEIANIDYVSKEELNDIEKKLEKKLYKQLNSKTTQGGGIKTTINILNKLEGDTEKTILNSIATRNPELKNQLNRYIFEFEDLVGLDKEKAKNLLSEINLKELATALKFKDEEFVEKTKQYLPEKSKKKLEEELETLINITKEEAKTARSKIVSVAKELELKD